VRQAKLHRLERAAGLADNKGRARGDARLRHLIARFMTAIHMGEPIAQEGDIPFPRFPF